MPKNRMPTMTSVVITGRLMKSVVKFMRPNPRGGGCASVAHGRCGGGNGYARLLRGAASRRELASHPVLQLVEVRIEHRRHVQRDDLREREAADDGDAERAAGCAGGADPDGDRERARDGRDRR